MDTTTIAPPKTIVHKSLSAAVKAAGLFSARGRCAKPVLQSINVQSGNGILIIEAGDTSHSVKIALPTDDTSDQLAIQLDVEAARAVSLFSGNTVDVIRDERGARSISAGGVTMPANGDPAELCRLTPPSGETRTVSIPWRAWVATESAIEPATDKESSRYALGAVLLQTANGRGFFIGTDGQRLHAMSAPVQGDEGTVLITGSIWGKVRKCVKAVARSTTGLTERKLAAALADTAVSVTTDGFMLSIVWTDGGATVTVTTGELQGRFPRWKDVFPRRPDAIKCTFDGPTLRREVSAAGAVTTAQTKAVTFRRDSLGAPAELSAVGIRGASFAGPLSGDVPAGVRVGLDPRFVVDMIDAAGAVLPGAPLVVETTDKLGAVIAMVGAGLDAAGDDYGLAAVIMPLEVGD
jgi:DNA polymerase III sliding clamp (beta) subunit (PCNA family)